MTGLRVRMNAGTVDGLSWLMCNLHEPSGHKPQAVKSKGCQTDGNSC